MIVYSSLPLINLHRRWHSTHQRDAYYGNCYADHGQHADIPLLPPRLTPSTLLLQKELFEIAF